MLWFQGIPRADEEQQQLFPLIIRECTQLRIARSLRLRTRESEQQDGLSHKQSKAARACSSAGSSGVTTGAVSYST